MGHQSGSVGAGWSSQAQPQAGGGAQGISRVQCVRPRAVGSLNWLQWISWLELCVGMGVGAEQCRFSPGVKSGWVQRVQCRGGWGWSEQMGAGWEQVGRVRKVKSQI